MKMRYSLAALALAFSVLGVSSTVLAAATVLTGAHVLAPSADHWLEGRAVLIEDDHIAAVAPLDEIEVPDDAQTIDLSGLYLIPGMIDLHTHLLLRPYDEESWNDQVLTDSSELRTLRAAVGAWRTLEAGFTTIRDLGTEGAGYADVALKQAIDSGLISGPRLVVVTRAIVATGCYGPSGFAPNVNVPKGAQEASGIAGVRTAVRQQIAGGADWIKVYADYRRAPGAPATPTFSREELDALVHEAHSAGKPVSAHASTDEGIRRAVRAGVQTIEHGYGASPETLHRMRTKGVVLCPTLAASEAVAIYAGWDGAPPIPQGVQQSMDMFRAALDAGVAIACGSDAGVFDHGDNAHELELMVAYGMTPTQAMHAATITAAKVLGRPNELGAIAPGFAADLVALRSDPLKDIAATREVVMVMARGEIVREER